MFTVAKVVLFIIHLFLTCFLLLRFCSKWGFLYVQKLAYLFKKPYNPCIYQGFIVLLQQLSKPSIMKRTKVFYNALILLATLLLTACQDQKDIPEVSSPEKNLVLSDYISNQKVKSICEDRYGQIWIGTFRGLNKYDGNQYHQYYCVDDSLGLPDNNITDIYRDSHNRLWVATVNGVCLYQANGNFNRVSINGTNKNIEKILEDKEGRIFFLTITDLYQYNENTNTAIIKLSKMLEKNSYNISCHIDRKDVMWIVTPYSVKGYRTQDLKLIAQSPVQNYPIVSFLLDGHQLYLSGYNGMQLFDTNTRKWQHLPVALQGLQIPNDMVNCIHPYGAKGNLLLSTTKHGLFYFNAQEGGGNHPDTKRQEFPIRSA